MTSDSLVTPDGPADEIPLPGGNVGGAVRVGDTVRRPTGPWTPAVHELLDFLADAGLPRIPRVLGIDDRDREILTFLPGQVLDIGRETLSDAQVRSAMQWLREYHAVVAGFPRGEPPLAVRRACAAAGRDRLPPRQRDVQHGVRRRRPGGRLRLGRRRSGDPAGRRGDLRVEHGRARSRHAPADEVAHVLRTIADGYGDLDPHAILDHVVVRMTDAADRIAAAQAAGDPGMLRLGEIGEPAATRARLTVLAARLPELHAALDVD